MTLAYFALSYGGAALLAVVAIALIPSILAARPFGFVLLDVYEIVASIWRTRGIGRRSFSSTTITQRIRHLRHRLSLSLVAAIIAVLIVATRWIPSHLGPASAAGALSSPDRSNTGRQETLFAPAKLPRSHTAQAAVTGAPSPAFRRVRVGPNEVDYIAEDVTIRQFTPALSRPRTQTAYKEVHIGADVTIRYFASKPAAAPRTRRVSLDRSLPLSN